MINWKEGRIGSVEKGTNPMVLAGMKSDFAVTWDTQLLLGLSYVINLYY